MKKFMSQEQFDYCVCFVTLSSFVTEHDEIELIEMSWQEYERYLLDDYVQFKLDVLDATVRAKQMLSDMDVSSHPSFLKAFQSYIEKYNLDGTKKTTLKKLFSGAMFAKSEQNPKRVQDFLNRMNLFYAKIVSGAYNP